MRYIGGYEMKVEQDSVNIRKPQSGRAELVSPTQVRTPTASPRSAGGDQVEVSAKSQLHSLASSIGEESRTQRVEQLRSLVSSGNYTVDTGALGGAIITSMLQGG